MKRENSFVCCCHVSPYGNRAQFEIMNCIGEQIVSMATNVKVETPGLGSKGASSFVSVTITSATRC